MDFVSPEAEQRYAEVVAAAAGVVVGLDFDGVLAPIVDDPAAAHIHPDAAEVLPVLSREVATIAVITGRPARQALALGGLDEIGAAIGAQGRELHIYGQYGNEHWSSSSRRILSPRPPHGLPTFELGLPRLLRRAGAPDAVIEEKGLAVAVHTRMLEDPSEAFDRLLPVLTEEAARYKLSVEPGRHVIEVRSGDMDKGRVVARLAEDVPAGGFVYVGDDLGDVPAFEAAAELRAGGLPVLLVASASTEENALVAIADVVVPGPDGVLDLLRSLAADAAAS